LDIRIFTRENKNAGKYVNKIFYKERRARYFSSLKPSFSIRKAIVHEALQKGIKPPARRWHRSKHTVKGSMKRFEAEGNDELMDRRSGAKVIAHKTAVIHNVIAFRNCGSF
jgi:hypothetical protein